VAANFESWEVDIVVDMVPPGAVERIAGSGSSARRKAVVVEESREKMKRVSSGGET
jgi:hypothetical protein